MPILRMFTIFVILSLLIPLKMAFPSQVEREYREAKSAYHRLNSSTKRRRYRQNWLNVIYRFEDIYKHYPKSAYAPKSLFMIGRLYRELYSYSYRKGDLDKSIEFYRLLVNTYPDNSLSDDAQFQIAEITYKQFKKRQEAYEEYLKVVEFFPDGDMVKKAKKRLKELKPFYRGKGFSRVVNIRHWSNPSYTRVVIDLDRKVSVKSHLLKKDPKLHKPPRLYIDLTRSKLKGDMKKPIHIGDGLLKQVRAGQYTSSTVRVVLDLVSLSSYKIFSLEEPFRVVIDIRGDKGVEEVKKGSQPTIAQQLGLKIKRIVLDPGHGGKDPGAIGKHGLKEKDVVLKIARLLKKKLSAKGYKVLMTRDRDVFIPLEERTAFANTKEADLFVSIHANASPRRSARGIETYYLNFTNDKEAMRVASRENATSNKKMGDLQFILYDLMQTSKINESSRLAYYVQNSITRTVSNQYVRVDNLGTKQAPFYVLIGANMPSILIETSFISNPTEEKRLRDNRYLELIADGILKGIERYIESMTSVTSLSFSVTTDAA